MGRPIKPRLRFGLALPHYDYSLPGTSPISWHAVKDWGQKAEELGFDSVWVSDHLFLDVSKYGGSADPQGAMECWTTLAALSSTTTKVRFGSLVACNDRRAPSLVAKMAATIDVLSGGRLEVGLGAGWYEPEFKASGIPFRRAGERIDRLEEAIQIVVGMLSGSPFTFEGRYYAVYEAMNLPAPVQQPRPPVFVGGKGDRMVKLAARHADGYNAVWAWTPEAFKGRLDLLDETARKAGRDPAEIRRTVGLYVLGADDDEGLDDRYRAYLDASPPGVGEGQTRQEWSRDKLAGDPSAIVARILEFEKLGVDEVILGFGVLPFQIADPEAVEWFAREVLHRLERAEG